MADIVKYMMKHMILTSTKKSIRSQVVEYYRRKIKSGELPAGSVLPSAQRLAEELGTAETNIHHAMTTLVREGLISRRPRTGSVVIEQPERITGAAIYLDHLHLRRGESFTYPFIDALKKSFAKHGITPHVVYAFDPEQGMRDLKRLAEQQVIQGCIFRSIGAADYENICKLPIVCCGMSSMRIPGAAYFFNENLVRRSFEALQMSGCRTFGVIGAFSFDEKNSRFTELLLHHAAEYGLRIRDEWKYTKDRIHGNRPVVDMKEFGYTAMETFWKMKKRPEGLLVYSDDLSSGITLSLYQNRIQVPEDVRLVIHRTVESREICPFPCIFVESSIAEMAEILVKNLRSLYAGKKIIPHQPGCEIAR